MAPVSPTASSIKFATASCEATTGWLKLRLYSCCPMLTMEWTSTRSASCGSPLTRTLSLARREFAKVSEKVVRSTLARP